MAVSETYKVKSIVGHRIIQDQVVYDVKWVNYDAVTETKLSYLYCPELILKYECELRVKEERCEVKSWELTDDQKVIVQWRKPVKTDLLEDVHVSVLHRISQLREMDVPLQFENYQFVPSNNHNENDLYFFCNTTNLKNLKRNKHQLIPLKHVNEETRKKLLCLEDIDKYHTKNRSEVTLYPQLVPLLSCVAAVMSEDCGLIVIETGFCIRSTRFVEDIVVLKTSDSEVPFLSIELKVDVHLELQSNRVKDVVEMFAYAKYLLKIYKLKKIMCTLTNTFTWHIFQYDGYSTSQYSCIQFKTDETFVNRYLQVGALVRAAYDYSM